MIGIGKHAYRPFCIVVTAAMLIVPVGALAQDEPDESVAESSDEQAESSDDLMESAEEAVEIEERRSDEAALIEDPEAQRRARALAAREAAEAAQEAAEVAGEEPEEFKPAGSLEFYGSVRAHVINNYDATTGKQTTKVADGNSRAGTRADWQYKPGWYFFGRAEIGFNIFDSYTTRTDQFGDDDLELRLAYVGIDHEHLTLLAGKNWSAYYQVAGVTDRFAIFGGSASGVYNAGTVGDATGTGRAKDILQARVYVSPGKNLFQNIKPFNVNIQYQLGQPIPFATSEKYDYSYGISAFLETNSEYGVTWGIRREG